MSYTECFETPVVMLRVVTPFVTHEFLKGDPLSRHSTWIPLEGCSSKAAFQSYSNTPIAVANDLPNMLRFAALLLCIAAIYTPGHCERGVSRDVEHARLPEFLTELDLSSLEASEEDVEALKKIVKRLAPEKNGEYQVYQVFFGNEDLLKEWLKGAGVTGQPGVDYPALTSIPATSFSCRGLRGGYYADLETNCQVFHICDNGRKISFLCPNGTIFQQSQLICDWWFKVDCSKSTELYEQSAEQLAEEEKKRADARKMKSEFHRTVEQQGDVNYYDNQNVDYDGRQNGRTNPYGQIGAKQNQLPQRQEEPKSAQNFGPNNVFDNARDRYFQGNNANTLRANEKTNQSPENFNQRTKQRPYHDGGSNYQANNRQRNQLVDTQSSKFNYEHGNKFQDTRQNYQTTLSSAQSDRYRSNQNAARDNEKPGLRGPKSRTSTRNNLFGSSQSQKATPTYMETTTFRTTTATPPREYQQFAESAAFVSNRGNRFNSGKYESNRQFYYQSYNEQRDHSGFDGRETTTLTPDEEGGRVSFAPKTGVPPFPGPTYAPIYKPRTTTLPPYETTLQYTPTTETNFYSTPFYKQGDVPETTYFNYGTATVTPEYVESSTQGGNTFAFEVNRAFTTTTNSAIRGYDGDTRDSTDLSPVYDNYFPLEDESGNQNRVGGFHKNTSSTFQPYGKNVKPLDATPINNYVGSSTPASFQNYESTTSSNWGRGSAGERPAQNLTPPYYQRFGNVKSFEVSNSIVPTQIRSTTPLPSSKSAYQTASSTVQPFRIRYYEPTTTTATPEHRKASPESLVTARSSYAKFRNNYNRIEGTRRPADNVATTVATTRDTVGTLDPVSATYSDTDVTPYTMTITRATSSKSVNASSTAGQYNSLNNDHWTSSPMVTQLWETTVFVDPRHINRGLESSDETARPSATTNNVVGDEFVAPTVAATTVRSPTFSNEVPEETRTTTNTPSPWQWASNGNDSPVAFTLLPTTFTAENTATPTPIITTRSSITTTITSSVTSTNSIPHDSLASTLLPFAVTAGNALNATENEVIKAQEMFGKLNETSSETLMRVMQQADSNEMVRQLVLLLINHCNGPRTKTAEQEKEQLLDALLRMPVNEFSSEESREIVAGISRLNLSDVNTRPAALLNFTVKAPRASSVRPTSEPSITTFRSRTGRRFRTTTESTSSFARRSDEPVSDANNSLSEDETTASDNRALELLRSLYTIAAKWG
ncbi:hypothetical protein X777_12023 [Ooceraea biroi]|uniref:Chitin-binding type-2 domain-containing protein n=1 Tax=Ooceraea biroi TaxID=2015173 RepID=A0A026WZY7_OOCBI|nr:hypothetical protein X777_12023 [Ooceraea biroi]